jgi:hypothetical protein
MFRKTAFALATTAALGAAALAPTSASAHGFGHHGHWGWGLGVGIAAGVIGSAIVADSCLRREAFQTPYGWRTRWVNVCY